MKKILFYLSVLATSLLYSQNQTEVKPVLEDFKNLIKVRDFTVSSNEQEAYFTAQSMDEKFSLIVKVQNKNGKWMNPEIMNFSGKHKDLEPFLSPDELKLYFVSNRPLSDTVSDSKDYDIWYAERRTVKDDWSIPVNLGAPVNTGADEFYPSVSNFGNLYFTRPNPENKSEDDIFFSEYSTEKYSTPIVLSDSINTKGYEFNSYISPDESFLIFSGYNREDGFGSGDLYISYKNKNGKWTKAENMGAPINSDQMDYCPFLNTSTVQLYFTSRRSEVEAENIENFDQFLEEINSYENGLSRIYKVDFSDFIKQKK